MCKPKQVRIHLDSRRLKLALDDSIDEAGDMVARVVGHTWYQGFDGNVEHVFDASTVPKVLVELDKQGHSVTGLELGLPPEVEVPADTLPEGVAYSDNGSDRTLRTANFELMLEACRRIDFNPF